MARRIGGAGGGSDPGAGKAGAVVVAGVLAMSVAAGSGGLSLGGDASTTVDPVGTNLTRRSPKAESQPAKAGHGRLAAAPGLGHDVENRRTAATHGHEHRHAR